MTQNHLEADRPAQIEITEEMMEAGMQALVDHPIMDGLDCRLVELTLRNVVLSVLFAALGKN